MKLEAKAAALTIGAFLVHATPAAAQYGASQPAPTYKPVEQATPREAPVKVSKAAQKAMIELQKAVDAGDTAAIPAKLAAAQAVAQTPAEKYVVARLQLKAAGNAKDDAATAAAIEAMLASGGVAPEQTANLHFNLGKFHYKTKQLDKAAAAFEQTLAIEPANTDAMVLLAETRNTQKRGNEAVTLLQKAIQARSAAGTKADEGWYKRALALAYEAKMPVAMELGRQWVTAYPTSANWRDALRIYRNRNQLDDSTILDTLRLARATGALAGDIDFHMYAFAAKTSSPGEAKAVIEEATAAKLIDPNKPLFAEINKALRANTLLSRAALPALGKEALGAPTARLAVRTADAYFGYGDYDQAAELYRAALTKSGEDPNLVNLHLGMALARGGDKPGATAAFKAVTGPKAELAKFWLVYVATHP